MIKLKLYFAVACLLLWAPVCAQQVSCCSATVEQSFAGLATNPAFGLNHELPAPYVHDSESGRMIRFPVSDGKAAQGFLIRASEPTNKWLIVIHEWWGLNEHIKREADHLFHDLEGVNVIAIDLYDGKVAESREMAAKYMKEADPKRMEAIIEGAIGTMGKDVEIATIGWCFGGGWALQAAIAAGEKGAGCVMYYGMPEKETDKLQRLKAPVLGIFASEDKWITAEVVEEFQQLMDNHGKSLKVKVFKADHAFANPSSPRYNSKAARSAYVLSRRYLKQWLD
jgi:carboxymethylenebutenolidase